MPAPLPTDTPEKALLSTRIVWGAMLFSQILVFGVLYPQISATTPVPANNQSLAKLMPLIATVLVFVELPAAYFIRSIIFKKRTEDGVVAPPAFVTGNIVFFALCESVTLFVIVSCMITQTLWPTIVPAIAPLALFLLNFPTPRVMYPQGITPIPPVIIK